MKFEKLFPYQEKYLADLPSRAIMAADTGTGKTAMSIVHYYNKAYPAPLLILAPAAKVRTGDWERDIEEVFEALGAIPPHYEVYSYEKFSRNPSLKQFGAGKRALWHAKAPHYGGRQFAVIADEVHKAKDPQTDTGKAVYWAAKDADFFVGLSATSLPNGWIDLANYMKIFGLVRNISEFKKRYTNYVTYKGFPELKNYWHEDEMAKYWQRMSKRLTKAEAIELPARTFKGVDFKRPTDYVQTILTRKNAEGKELDNPSALAHALRQTLAKPKMAYLEELIEATSDNMVIFYSYEVERDLIMTLLKKKKFAGRRLIEQNGHKHEVPPKSEWASIERSITLAHYKSGGTGIEMTYATTVVYFSPTYSFAEYIQSVGRVYRHGQTSKTTFYNFRTPSTIEEDIYKCLQGKNDFQATQWVSKLKIGEKK